MINNLGGKISFGTGLAKADGMEALKQHSIKDIFGSKVIDIDRPCRDRTVNEEIEEKGAHFGASYALPR